MKRSLVALVASLLLPVSAGALEVRISVVSCNPGFACSWDLRIGADRTMVLEVRPQAHQSKRSTLSRKAFSALEAMLRREDFFSLPDHLGALVADGPQASIEVKDGSKQKHVSLDKLPEEWRAIWRTDTGATGRAFRVCDELRSLAGVPELLQCPGIPLADGKE